MDRAEILALLHTLADIALHRDAREAVTAMLTGSGADRQDRADVESTLTTLEASWSEEIAALRAEVGRHRGLATQTSVGSGATLALLQREFVFAQTP